MTNRGRSKRIAELNDALRTTFSPDFGRVFMSAGVEALPEELQAEVIAAVQEFEHWTEDNDPFGEHDCGFIRLHSSIHVAFKLDYYDMRMRFASPDPTNPAVTMRILTIMLASEW